MKHLFLILILLLVGCSSKRTTSPIVVPIQTTSNTRTVHMVTLGSAHVTLPQQSVRNHSPDSTSHLETDAAVSDAGINPDGSLYHSLENKTTPIPVPIENTADSVLTEKVIEVPVGVEVPVEVERKLTRWEKLRLDSWPYLVVFLTLLIIKIARNPIRKLMSWINR